ncbi:MAG TPA: hypothetical protein DCY13_14485, partial [Verrucomicrobiales bacterium]|nr:hypothetical protein [Verrucomicrobiales bacterium]
LPANTAVRFQTENLGEWDSSLLAWLAEFLDRCRARQIRCDTGTLPEGVRKTLELAAAVPEKTDTKGDQPAGGLATRIGLRVNELRTTCRQVAEFIGECTLAAGRLMRGRAQFRPRDLFLFMQEAGAEALGINLLIAFLVGLILAFVGAVQLQ